MPTRLNKFIALHTDFSRRGADDVIAAGRVKINGTQPESGQQVNDSDTVMIDGKIIGAQDIQITTIMFNKPEGYVCSKDGQGSKTIYDILPQEYKHLNSVGRLDKNSSGLLLLTNDGDLANELTHPRYQKIKRYEISLNKPLQPLHQQMISDYGIKLEDGVSKLLLEKQNDNAKEFSVTMHEGRNRQIRRTFDALGYDVVRLHRTTFGNYFLNDLPVGQLAAVQPH